MQKVEDGGEVAVPGQVFDPDEQSGAEVGQAIH